MKKFFLIIFILLDAAVIFVSISFLMARLKATQNRTITGTPSGFMQPTQPASTSPAATTPIASRQGVQPSTMSAPAAGLSAPAPAAAGAGSPSRKIRFSFYSAKAKKVMIRLESNGFRAEPMHKTANNVWQYDAVLGPGDWGYLFAVDDKNPVRDPANKRIKQIGKTSVSAKLVTETPAP